MITLAYPGKPHRVSTLFHDGRPGAGRGVGGDNRCCCCCVIVIPTERSALRCFSAWDVGETTRTHHVARTERHLPRSHRDPLLPMRAESAGLTTAPSRHHPGGLSHNEGLSGSRNEHFATCTAVDGADDDDDDVWAKTSERIDARRSRPSLLGDVNAARHSVARDRSFRRGWTTRCPNSPYLGGAANDFRYGCGCYRCVVKASASLGTSALPSSLWV